jgi:release factor glutamine methyltransferase
VTLIEKEAFGDDVSKQAKVINEQISSCTVLSEALSVSRDLLTLFQENLTFNDPMLESKIFVEHAFGLTSLQLITHCDDCIEEKGKAKLIESLIKRTSGYPIAYIVGHQPFWTLNLSVSEDTLIPRADSEVVVEHAITLPLPENASVLDLGTGTGAIALAIKAERINWQVMACDFKDEIIALAKSNAALNNLSVEFVKSDWFSSIANIGFDLIVSNPPYVESGSHWLEQGDVRFEPDTALSSGADGLDDIRHIIVEAISFLNKGGYLLLEHGHQQASEIQKLLSESGYKDVATIQDLNHLDRATIGRWLG